MTPGRSFDVIVVGGGIAGSTLAGVLARARLGVLVVEKESQFRDRIRGEGTWPWGVANIDRTGIREIMRDAVGLRGSKRYENGRVAKAWVFGDHAPGEQLELTFSHPGLQETCFGWAASQGATALRPAKAVSYNRNGVPSVRVEHDGRQSDYTARLVVGADGKLSGVRRWAGGETEADPEHHRMGGVMLAGDTIDRDFDNFCAPPGLILNWFPAGPELTRLYVVMHAERLRETGVSQSFQATLDLAKPYLPPGALTTATQAGPIGYFPNNDIWGTVLAGNDVVLIGDAAGAPDPTQGHGTAMLFRDVRELSELLLDGRDWPSATAEYADRRTRYYEVIREYDRWSNRLGSLAGQDPETQRMREAHDRASAADPTLGGFGTIEVTGPDGLVADEAARRIYFGEV
jgi:2-polyprenyl-6-methoxyphenol hydroxylase-like FAD-dependent oxidoreductase